MATIKETKDMEMLRKNSDGTYTRYLPKTRVENVEGAETPAGAQAKADEAEQNAKDYADSIKPTKVSQLENDVGYITSQREVSDSVSSTSSSVAASSKAVKTAYDKANDAYGKATANESNLNAHIGSRGSAHGIATTSTAGFMSSTDKQTLEDLKDKGYVIGSYTGTGESSDESTYGYRTISVGFTPSAVLLMSKSGLDVNCGGLAVPGYPVVANYSDDQIVTVEITSGGFKVYYERYGIGNLQVTNSAGMEKLNPYRYIAFK